MRKRVRIFSKLYFDWWYKEIYSRTWYFYFDKIMPRILLTLGSLVILLIWNFVGKYFRG